MPLFTRKYGLASFIDSDVYSALLDFRRFTTLDNHLYTISSIIGDGVISGWGVTSDTFPIISVSPGSGLVDGVYVSTQSSYDFTLTTNTTYYILAEKISDLITAQGCVSELTEIFYNDFDKPTKPTNLTATSRDENQTSAPNLMYIDLQWDANSERDFDHYNIYRSTDNLTFDLIDTATSAVYSDDNLIEDTTYYYEISSVDKSSNESDKSTTNATTPITTFLPPNPKDVSVNVGNEVVDICWSPPSNIDQFNINSFLITYQKLNTDNSVFSTSTSTISASKLYARLSGVENGHKYLVTIQTVDKKGRKSTGLTSLVVPLDGIDDPQTVVVEQSSLEDIVSITLSTSWGPPGSEYNPETSIKYRIYAKIDKYGGSESLPIETAIGQTNADIKLFNFGTATNPLLKPIPEQSFVTLRFTSVKLDGSESAGIRVRIKIDKYSQPQAPRSVNASFDFTKITVSWANNADTYKLKFDVYKRTFDEPYSDYSLVSTETLQNTNIFVLPTPDLGFTYKFVLTPIDIYGTIGNPVTTTVDIPTIDDFPSLSPPTQLSGIGADGIITLNWVSPLNQNNILNKLRVYRAPGKKILKFSQFTLLDELPIRLTEFKDYGVDSEQTYTYYIVSVDIYGRESLHPGSGFFNIQTVSVSAPVTTGLTALSLLATVENFDVLLEWASVPGEPYIGFEILRSKNNRHSWESIATINTSTDTDDYSYLDIDAVLGIEKIFYVIRKISNDSSIVASAELDEDNTIPIAIVKVGANSLTIEDIRRDISNLSATTREKTDADLLLHIHGGPLLWDPPQIDLNPYLIVTDWTTKDGKMWTTSEDISGGEVYDLSVDGNFPDTLYTIFKDTGKIIFAESIINGSVKPTLKLTITGISEISGILSVDKFDNLHARQVALGSFDLTQLPTLDHDGLTKLPLYPQRNTLKLYDNHTYQSDNSSFGNAITFFDITDKSASTDIVQDFESSAVDSTVLFNTPTTDNYTSSNVSSGSAKVSIEQSFSGNKSYKITIKFKDAEPNRWVKINTDGFNPIIKLDKHLGFKIMVMSGSFYMGLGIRESINESVLIGDDGGIIDSLGNVAAIEFVGVTKVTETDNKLVPQGQYLLTENPGFWRDIEFDLNTNVQAFTGDGNLQTPTGYATLEHINISINPDFSEPDKEIVFFIDSVDQRSDDIVASTSNGLIKSVDFGQTWSSIRYTETPIHKFYKANINGFLWGISSKRVYYSTNTDQWFEVPGISSIQYIYSITEDLDGDMFVSTDKGVFLLKTATYSSFYELTKTNYVTSLSSSCYAIWSSDEFVYVSTDYGIYKTQDKGQNWISTNLLDSDNIEPLFQLQIHNEHWFAISETSVYRKLDSESTFSILEALTEQFEEITSLWKFEIIDTNIYVSTNDGVYTNLKDQLFQSAVQNMEFDRVFPETELKNIPQPATTLNNIDNTLFIGTENNLYTVSDGIVYTINKYNTKDKPRFFVNDVELKTGYTYSVFNNILSVRNPTDFNSSVEAEKLPRNKYTIKAEWAQKNAEANILIYLNSEPKWVDFKIDETALLSSVNSIITQMDSSIEEDSRVIQSGNIILKGGTDGANSTPLITADTISQFLLDYSFVILDENDLPPVLLNGTTTTNRQPETIEIFKINKLSDLPYTATLSKLINFTDFSRAFAGGYLESELERLLSQQQSNGIHTYDGAVKNVLDILNEKNTYTVDVKSELENNQNFTAKDATGITIDAVHGTFDFSNYLKSNNTSFKKEDQLSASVYGCTIGNIGINPHTTLEDKMEVVNSGMDENLTDVVTGNFLKNGIFLDKTYGFENSENTSTINSSFLSAVYNNWYDINNSTVDFETIKQNIQSLLPEIVICTAWFTDEYFENILWVGTDNGILEFKLEGGELLYQKTVFINDTQPRINRIIIDDNSTLVCTNTSAFETFDFGKTWSELNVSNLPARLNNAGIINGNIVVATENSLWWSSGDAFGFSQPLLTLSGRLTGQDQINSESAFVSNIINLECNNFCFCESQLQIYVSNNGIDFFAVGSISQNGITCVNKMLFYKKMLWAGTDKGLYTDAGTVFAGKIQFALIQISNTFDNSMLSVIDLDATDDELFIATSTGDLYRYKDDQWISINTGLSTIHKIQIMSNGYIAVFAYNQGKVINTSLFDETNDASPVTIIDLGACT